MRKEIEDDLSWDEILRKHEDHLGDDWEVDEEHLATNWWSEKKMNAEVNEMGKDIAEERP